MRFPAEEEIKALREKYPEGTKVKLTHMEDLHAPAKGTTGIVKLVDDIGTIHVKWENGSTLGLIEGEDTFEII
jgi:hypothetical protein